MHNIASLSSLPTVSSSPPPLSVPVHAWISDFASDLAIELRPSTAPSALPPYPSPLLLLLPSFLRPDPSTKADEREQRVDEGGQGERGRLRDRSILLSSRPITIRFRGTREEKRSRNDRGGS